MIADLVLSYEGGFQSMNSFIRNSIREALMIIQGHQNEKFDRLMFMLKNRTMPLDGMPPTGLLGSEPSVDVPPLRDRLVTFSPQPQSDGDSDEWCGLAIDCKSSECAPGTADSESDDCNDGESLRHKSFGEAPRGRAARSFSDQYDVGSTDSSCSDQGDEEPPRNQKRSTVSGSPWYTALWGGGRRT